MRIETGAVTFHQDQPPIRAPLTIHHGRAAVVMSPPLLMGFGYIKREISTMKLVRHPCVVRLYEPGKLLLDSQGNLKISDYGLSALPERVLSHKGYNGVVADVWSCGVILYVLSHNS
ncbi:hypothetical protein IGI04_027007 [Brassica rapa subsp. trilocularis]|uniref:Protein kinase domain-containing protein n=1 Tax=Brassica rapa subsp. trilocularis TaxID=1813537 RepID=A0ABQ7L0E5_BRACM|nr:hypothetical protein IGI04_027007 [Brassica rapa subsp. trilocularis]